MKHKITLSIGLAALTAVAIIGIAAAPQHKHDVVVLQACATMDTGVQGPDVYRWTNVFRLQATDGSAGTAFVPVVICYTNNGQGFANDSSGNLRFADVLATYLDHGYKIVAGNAFGNQGTDPICVVLVRE